MNAPAKLSLAKRPRLGFAGVGWIGRSRLEAIARSGTAEIVAIADAQPEKTFAAAALAPEATLATCFDQLLEMDLDGIVIATPNAFHVGQSIAALQRGISVFCQKPLARTALETGQIIQTARRFNCLLGVDLSWRGIPGVRKIRELLRGHELGKTFAAELVFHNSRGPDRTWFYDPKLSGGGCVIDLGTHLVDLALWCLDFPQVMEVNSRLFSKGEPLKGSSPQTEDYALARLVLAGGVAVQLSCSWKLPVGCDAIISGSFYGTEGGAQFRNVNGSLNEFIAARLQGAETEMMASPPGPWDHGAALDWIGRLAENSGYDPGVEGAVQVASVLDRIYGRTS